MRFKLSAVRYAILAMTACWLALASAASASGAVISDQWGHERVQPWQGWADRTLIPLPPASTIAFAPCPEGSVVVLNWGCASDPIYIDPASPARDRQRIMFHEIAHRIDATYFTDADRDAFRRIGAAAGGPWLDNTLERASAGEQFAEAFSLCAIHRVWDPSRYTFFLSYWKPGPVRHQRVCSWLRGTAQRWSS